MLFPGAGRPAVAVAGCRRRDRTTGMAPCTAFWTSQTVTHDSDLRYICARNKIFGSMDLLYILDSLSNQKCHHTELLRNTSNRNFAMKRTTNKCPFADIERISTNSAGAEISVVCASGVMSKPTFFPRAPASFKCLRRLPQSFINGLKSHPAKSGNNLVVDQTTIFPKSSATCRSLGVQPRSDYNEVGNLGFKSDRSKNDSLSKERPEMEAGKISETSDISG